MRHPELNIRHPEVNIRHHELNIRHPELVSGSLTSDAETDSAKQCLLRFWRVDKKKPAAKA